MKAANTRRPLSLPPQLRGFTLLELMTAVTVMGILLGLGVPAFNSMIRGNQIAAEGSNLVSALNLARSEALKRGVRVSVCAAGADLKSCAEEADWSNGWILFEDDFGDAGVIDDSDVLLQIWGAPADGVVLDTEEIAVTFSRQARAEFEATFQVTKSGCSGDQQRQIYVDISGRINLQRVACT